MHLLWLRPAWERFRKAADLPFFVRSYTKSLLGISNPKVFVIGRNKTGTTSLKEALTMLGYWVGNQRTAELLMEDWGKRDFRRLIRYCHSADAFQDVPFSYHYTFQALDAAFPGSKFILSVRGSADEWYQSVVRFHSMRLKKRTGENRIPTLDDIRQDPYVYPGYLWRVRELVGVTQGSTEPYPENELKHYYERHNAIVQDYFRNRPNDLLVINVAESDSMRRLCEFLGHSDNQIEMPMLNKSST
jgi:hypothetical protein